MYHIEVTERVPGLPTTVEKIRVDSKEAFDEKLELIYSGYEGDDISYSKLIELIREGCSSTLEIELYSKVGKNRYELVENHAFLMTSTMISDLKK